MGQITIWDLGTFEDIKNIVGVYLSPTKLLQSDPEIAGAFYACDRSGMMLRFELKQKFFMSTLDKNIIYNRGESN